MSIIFSTFLYKTAKGHEPSGGYNAWKFLLKTKRNQIFPECREYWAPLGNLESAQTWMLDILKRYHPDFEGHVFILPNRT
jgi:hypothetical protein